MRWILNWIMNFLLQTKYKGAKELMQFSFAFLEYVIPGFLVFSVSVIAIPINFFQNVIDLTFYFNTGLATVYVIVAYTLVFCVYSTGIFLYKTIGIKPWWNRIKEDWDTSTFSAPTKYALLRHHSPSNFKYVESRNSYIAMAHNLLVACLIYWICSLVKAKRGNNTQFWAGTFVLGMVLFFIVGNSAVTYFHWAAYNLTLLLVV